MTIFDIITRRRALACLALAWHASPYGDARAATSATQPAALALLTEARPDIDPVGYLVSEKLDGVRAIWDGHRLRFRSGRPLSAPAWFTEAWPATACDGELWCGRGHFDVVSGTVRRDRPDDALWRAVRFMIFDLPGADGSFAERAAHIAQLAKISSSGFLVAVEQSRVTDRAYLRSRLAEVVQGGGEGLVLHRADALWKPGRSEALLKLKPLQDAEAQVLAHEPGRGRLAGVMGSLQVRNSNGVRFRVGTGFTDTQRREPPPLGSWITYTHRGFTSSGVPRFASYWRPHQPEL